MVTAFCLICSTYEKKRDRRSFYQVPQCNFHSNSIEKELIERRRAEWLKLSKSNFNKSKLFVCSDHFVSGKPAFLNKTEDIDWVPTKNLKTQPDNVPSSLNSSVLSSDVTGSLQSRNEEVSTASTEGCNNTIFEEQINVTDSSRTEFSVFQYGNDAMDESSMTDGPLHSTFIEPNDITTYEECLSQLKAVLDFFLSKSVENPNNKTLAELMLLIQLQKENSMSNTECGSSECNTPSKEVVDIDQLQVLQRSFDDLTRKLDDSLQEEVLLRQKVDLLGKVLDEEKLINKIRNNDQMTKYYTGLHSWCLFEIIFELVLPGIEHCSMLYKKSISYEEQFLLVLMRLRLNLGQQDLAYRFKISVGAVCKYIGKWIDVMYVRLSKNFLVWPDRQTNKRTMPSFFKRKFPNCIAIIDCFEIAIERPKNLLARCSTYSHYKSRPTAKYLIAITPRGAISYISMGYGGRQTDVHIILDKKNVALGDDEGFISKLEKGDEVLADRGFLVKNAVEKRGAKLTTPSFLSNKVRLTRRETAFSRKVSNVRIHVERVIGRLRENFQILTHRVPIQYLRSGKSKFAFLDKIVFVCCCLNNANPSVVPPC